MNKLYILAALLMATTSAQAGGITFQVNGERIRIEAPRNCNALSCVKVTAPGYNGTIGNIDLKGIGSKKDDDYAVDEPRATLSAPAPAPVQATAPQPPAPVAAAPAPAPAPSTVATATPARSDVAPAPPAPPAPVAAAPAPAPQPAPVAVASDPNSPLGVWSREDNNGNGLI